MRDLLPDFLARRPLVPLLLLAASLLLWHLGAYGLWESTEARYAEIAAHMVRSGDWMTPRLNGIAHFDKPPLAYWASAASLAVGGIDELGARLPLVLASLAGLVIVYGAASATMCPRAAVFAFLVLLSSPMWFALSRSLTTDLYLTLWIVVAVEAARRGTCAGGSRGWRLAAWAAVGLGFMTKGPIVFLWTAAPLLVWAAWTRSWSRVARLADPVGGLVFALVAIPWYVVEAVRHPGLMDFWLGGQIAGRVATPYRGEAEPSWFYLLTLAWASGVWVIPAVAMLWRLAREPGRPGGRFLVCWVVVPFLVFSLLPTKRTNYMLPAVPAIALAAGLWWDRALSQGAPLQRAIPRALSIAVAVFGALLVAAAFVVADMPSPVTRLGWLFGPTFVLGGAAAWRAARRARLDLAFAALLLPLLGLYLGLVATLAHPRVEAWSKISRPLIREIAAHRLSDEPIVNYHVWLRAIPFYLDERVITISEAGRVTSFEEDDSWRDYVFTADSSFFRMLGQPERRLAVVPRGDVEEIEARLGRRVAVLAKDSRNALITNQP